MTDEDRWPRKFRAKAFEVLNSRACGWCFRNFPLDKLKPKKRGNGLNSHICETCASNIKPKKKP